MTPEEKAVIDAAIALREYPRNDELDFFYPIVDALIFSCPKCNAGGHTCPGDGNPISHTATDCGQHDEERDPIWTPATLLYCLAGDHIRIGTDETDVLRSNRGVWNVSKQQMGWKDGAGNWQGEYVKGAAPWFPAEHRVELRLDLSANPGFRKYLADTPCEILCTPERLAVLTLMTVFPGTKEIKP